MFAALFVVIGYGYKDIVVDTTIVNLIKPGHGFREAYTTVDNHFGGAASVEIVIDTSQAGGVKSANLIKAIDKFQKHVEEKYSNIVSKTYSLANITITARD